MQPLSARQLAYTSIANGWFLDGPGTLENEVPLTLAFVRRHEILRLHQQSRQLTAPHAADLAPTNMSDTSEGQVIVERF